MLLPVQGREVGAHPPSSPILGGMQEKHGGGDEGGALQSIALHRGKTVKFKVNLNLAIKV